MSDRAFVDKARTQSVWAGDVGEELINKWFYCPNPHCNAHLMICSLQGNYQPYFAARDKRYPHVPGCFVNNSKSNGWREYSEEFFNYEEIIEKLMTKDRVYIKSGENVSGVVNNMKKIVNSISELYNLCKSYGVNQEYNNYLIGNICLDERSQSWYEKGVYGYKLIEASIAKGKFYYKDGKIIRIKRMVNNKEYTFVMECQDKKLFWQIIDGIFKNVNGEIVIAGKWEKYAYNTFLTGIFSKKQIVFVKEGIIKKSW